MTNDISDKNRKDWNKFINSKEKLLDKDYKHRSKKIFKTRSIDLHGYTLDDANRTIEKFINEADQDNIANYLGSFFEKEAFHELCIEQIVEDLKSFNYLFSMVEGYFERRGGIAIIPRRYS